MTAPLHALKILVPESRELDLFAAMLEEEGAATLRCPMVRILDLEDTGAARAWIGQLMEGQFQDVIWLTGEGLRRLVPIAQSMGRAAEFAGALARTRAIVRGPKPARALRELGLPSGLPATTPTSQGVLDVLAGEDIAGRTIGLQLYPEAGTFLADSLAARGAKIFPVVPYRYASQAETGRVAEMIHMLGRGEIDMVAFTATPQIERLFAVARETGLEKELAEGLARTPIAAIGPVLEEGLRAHGLASTVHPSSSFHLKPLVRAIVTWRNP